MSVNKTTISKINVNQNIIIKSMLGISKFCHTSELLRVLRLFDINSLVTFMKLNFIKNLKNNYLSYKIFSTLLNNIDQMNPKSKSFISDYRNICCNLRIDSVFLLNNINKIIIDFKNNYFNAESDEINFMLIKSALQNDNIKDRLYSLNLILKY